MGVSIHFVMSSAPALHDELQCIHNLTKPPGFLTGANRKYLPTRTLTTLSRSRLRGSYLTRTPDSETLSPGVFTPVLAKRSNPNRCHWPYVASRKLRPSAQEYVWLRCAELAPFRR